MTLVLSLKNVTALSNGGSLTLTLERRGAAIGRSPTVDWTLPDPSNFISSRHCEVRFEGDSYLLRDTSTNGTIINGAPMTGPHRLQTGDVIVIGQYEVAVALPGQVAVAADTAGPGWQGWGAIGTPTGDSNAGSDWGKPKPKAALAGDGPVGASWAPPPMAPAAAPPMAAPPIAPPPAAAAPPVAGGGWGAPAPTPAAAPPPPAADQPWGAPAPGDDWAAPRSSDWSSQAAPPPPSPTGKDIWGQLAEVNAVDWSRSNFGAVEPPPAADPLGLAGASGAEALGNLPPVDHGFGLSPTAPPQAAAATTPAAAPAAQPAAAPVAAPAAMAQINDLNAQLAAMLGLGAGDLRQDGQATLAAMATMLRSLLSGMVVMVEARARAKAQLGAQATILQFEGNNPLKFARTPEQAMAQMLNPPERGFMPAERAIEDAFVDLQSHQMATLKAMQGALRATLDRFSPKAISQRVQSKGLLSQILPGAQDAALWRAYVKEFSGVSEGSDEAFMEVFAREFRKAYEEESSKRR